MSKSLLLAVLKVTKGRMNKKSIKKIGISSAILVVVLASGIILGSIFAPINLPGRKNDLQIGGQNGFSGILTSQTDSSDEPVVKTTAAALPSVVTVKARKEQNFSDFPSQNPKNWTNKNIGSGFIVTSDGWIITNKHVVFVNQFQYSVLTSDGKEYPVTEIKTDPNNDIALLKVNATGLKPIKLGDSDKLRLGESVIAIGSPFGDYTNTVTTGVVSGLNRELTVTQPISEHLTHLIQTSAPINPGNSGGPLINEKGEVIGMNSAGDEKGQNIGFAIPINEIKAFIGNNNLSA